MNTYYTSLYGKLITPSIGTILRTIQPTKNLSCKQNYSAAASKYIPLPFYSRPLNEQGKYKVEQWVYIADSDPSGAGCQHLLMRFYPRGRPGNDMLLYSCHSLPFSECNCMRNLQRNSPEADGQALFNVKSGLLIFKLWFGLCTNCKILQSCEWQLLCVHVYNLF